MRTFKEILEASEQATARINARKNAGLSNTAKSDSAKGPFDLSTLKYLDPKNPKTVELYNTCKSLLVYYNNLDKQNKVESKRQLRSEIDKIFKQYQQILKNKTE